MIQTDQPIRNATKPFCLLTSVHKDISERLPQFNRGLYLQVKEVLDVNKAQRHIRGGIATRKKYRGA
ncbi:MAG: sporulation transcriptional regulator SpoIIID [Oscillospiraceae bacterium]|nr:sporulation transcriptional regulator SpoIIID [Oscillospiraceae bacterium]